MHKITQSKSVVSTRFVKTILSVIVTTALISSSANATSPVVMSKQHYVEKRSALIATHSKSDNTFVALKAQVSPNDETSSEYWSWRIDQYLYGQYPEFQAIYNAYTNGKTFHQIYNLPPEDLSGKKNSLKKSIPELPAGHFTGNLEGNPHRGDHYVNDGKVYITYQGHLTDPYIASFDLKDHSWEGPYKAADSTLSKGKRNIDSHGRPIIEQDSKGHFHIVYGGHGGEREDGLNPMSIDTPHAGGRMLHAISEKPDDISSFTLVDDISPFASYTKSHTMANGDIYLFTRAGTHKSPWVYYKMKNGEQQFQPPVIISWPTPQQDNPINVDTFYINPLKVSDTEIAISFLWHECNFLEVHDKTTYSRVNAYYMKFDTTTDTFYNAQDKKLSLPMTLASANKHTLAFDSTQREETPFGTVPVILDNKAPALAYEARTKNYREWRMAEFKNGKWEHSLPLPGTEKRTVKDNAGVEIKKVLNLEVINNDSAVVIYKNKQGKSVFSTAKAIGGSQSNWQVEKEHLSMANTRLQMESVKDSQDNTVAVVLNVRKEGAQRLYLWHEGTFHGVE